MTTSKVPLKSASVPDALNVHRAAEFYDVDSGEATEVHLLKICHSIVHSYVLSPTFTYSGPEGLRLDNFLLASDRERWTHAYTVRWDQFSRAIAVVAADDVVGLRVLRTGRGEELRFPMSSAALSALPLSELVDYYANLSRDNARAVRTLARRFAEVQGRPHPDLLNYSN